VDPGDREVPLRREHGDPFEGSISEDQRASRLEGRKVYTRTTVGSTVGESMFRVDRFRKFIDRRGADGRGLIQFWGPRATRTYKVDDGAPAWEVQEERKMHTVTVGNITKIK
jgi:hypothetical protein